MQIHSKTRCESFPLETEGGRYEVFVNLPLTYGERPEARYPVLYMVDGNLMFGNVTDAVRIAGMTRVLYPQLQLHGAGTPEMIVVAIGYPGEDALAVARETVLRRIYDYTARTVPGAPLQDHCLAVSPKYKFGGASAFLRMLTVDVRREIEQRFRVDAKLRLLFGGSAGGHFAAYTLLNATDAFTHYIIASPAIELCGEDIYDQEASYAAAHADMPVAVFMSFGTREWEGMSGIRLASGTTRFAEKLLARNYPSLRLHLRILPDEAHEGAIQTALPRGLETLLGA
jgi:predicted alpha/beta superfamily hydrolase